MTIETPSLVLSPARNFILPRAVQTALWLIVPIPMLIYVFMHSTMGGADNINEMTLYIFAGVTVLFFFEALFLPKLFNKLRPEYKLEFYIDHMVLQDGRNEKMALPYSTVKDVSSTPSVVSEDELLDSRVHYIDVLIEFDLDHLAEYGRTPDNDTLVVKNIADVDSPLRRVQDLVRPYQNS